MANLLAQYGQAPQIDPHTGQPIEWSAARAPAFGIDGLDPQAIALLQNAGLWDDQYAVGEGQSGTDPASRAQARQEWQSSPGYQRLMQSLSGYTQGQARQDYTLTDYLRGPDGNVASQFSYQDLGPSLRTSDYLKMAAVIGGGLAASSAFGAAGVGSGLGGATGGGLNAAIANGALQGGVAGGGVGATASGLTGAQFASLGGAGLSLADAGSGTFSDAGGGAEAFGGDPTRAAMYSDAGYGPGMTGAETASYSAPGGGGFSWDTLGSNAGAMFNNPNTWMQLGQAGLGLVAQNRAAGAMQDGLNQQNALARETRDLNRADAKPWLDAGASALGQIQALLKDPSSVANEPGYQFGLKQGQDQINNQMAARGGYYSGQQLKASQKYGQDYASTKMDQTYNRLANIAGIGQTGLSANTNANNAFGNTVGGNMATGGNVRGSQYIGGANVVGNALGNIGNEQQQNDMLRRYFGGGGG